MMTNNPEYILKVTDISNTYGTVPLLKNLDFSLNKGEILCLLGPSGSGKTTLLRILAGLEEEFSGNIEFQGQNLIPIPSHKRNIGMMFQDFALFPHLSVRQNVSFGLEMKRLPKDKQDRKVAEMLRLVGLEGFDDRRVDELSGGEKQRVALARSLAPEPDLLLLDEPLGSLDRILRNRLTQEIRAILKSLGVTAIFVTHDQEEAFGVSDKIGILHNGELQQFDTPEMIYRTPANSTVAAFLGFTNVIHAGSGQLETLFENYHCLSAQDNTSPEKSGLVLLRPDGVQLASQGDEQSSPLLGGRVKCRIFQGASYRLDLVSKSYHFSFNLPLHPQPPGEGEEILLLLHPEALIQLDK